MIPKCFEMRTAASLPGFHQPYVSSRCVGLSEPISPAAEQSLLHVRALLITEINFLEVTPK